MSEEQRDEVEDEVQQPENERRRPQRERRPPVRYGLDEFADVAGVNHVTYNVC